MRNIKFPFLEKSLELFASLTDKRDENITHFLLEILNVKHFEFIKKKLVRFVLIIYYNSGVFHSDFFGGMIRKSDTVLFFIVLSLGLLKCQVSFYIMI